MSEQPLDNAPKKRVDFSPYTYQKLLRNLKRIWSNIEYETYVYIALRNSKYTRKDIEDKKGDFERLKKEIETKIDLLLERTKTMIDNAEKGEQDFDYQITCHSVGAGFSLEEHLRHLQPAVAFSKVFKDPRERGYA